MYPDNPSVDRYYDDLERKHEKETDEELKELKYEHQAGEWD